MKLTLLVILLIVVLLGASAFLSQVKTPQQCTASEVLPVYRNLPNPNTYKLIDRLEKGETVIVTGRVDGWYEVATPRLVEGFVDGGLCQ